ncbi:RIP metalloprotease RseP [Flavobacterium sp.]|uniref:RIP metalloprotease RseP n=1 Tax=Flavobacterium sp. TaxID=239 RepID=UPI00260DD2C5|nr:RIP metalloprotease RseP [Flavobacterium sp.]MDD3004669.1 RIP metalloprotease RseP [Flavobacterium sp.]
MELLIKLSQFLLSLSLLIVLHELGHFIPAKLFKTRVEKFYLFFDVKFSLLKKKIGDTEYGIGWLPLGGYVKISGMIDESMDTEAMAQPAQPWEFRSKPAWQRLIIMLGGVTVNFILAFIIYIGMAWVYGDLYIDNKDIKDGVWITNPVVEQIGLKTGDKILTVDGEEVKQFHDLNAKLFLAKKVEIERNGTKQIVELPVNFIDKMFQGEKAPIVDLRIPFVVVKTEDGSVNANSVQPKDILINFNGNPVKYADEVLAQVKDLKGKTVPAIVTRDGKEVPIQLKVTDSAKMQIVYAGRINASNIEQLGTYPIQRQEYSFVESFGVGINKGFDQLASYGRQLKAIFNPNTGAYKGVGGFKAIFDIFPEQWSWQTFWNITALLSIMLGVMNLLPIPALDGGHVMFLLYEIISGKKPSDKFLEKAQVVGFVLLIALVLFANGNDIYRAIIGK